MGYDSFDAYDSGDTTVEGFTDRHGDLWLSNGDGTYRNWTSGTPGYLSDWTKETVEREWGPLTVHNGPLPE